MKENKILKFAAASIIATGISIHNYANENLNMKYAKKEPIKEEIMVRFGNEITEGFGKETLKNIEKIEFLIPTPSTKAVSEEDILKGENQNYAVREIKLKQTIKYYNFKITLYQISYTFKDVSATFVITAGEDEWKENLKLKNEKFIDYIDHDNEKTWRLKIKLDEIKAEEGKVVIRLMRKKINSDQVGKPDSTE